MGYRKLLAALGISVALGVASVPAAHANLVNNGGFETGDFSGWVTAVGAFSGVDALAAHSGNFGAFGGDFSTSTISQDIATTPGANYNIQFWLRSDGFTPNEFFINWDGLTVFSQSNIGAFAYTQFAVSSLATGATTTLQIGFSNAVGFLEFDDISVTAIPEPLSLSLLGAGFLGLVWARRKAA